MSYRDHIDFGIVADRNMIDDAWPLMDGLKAACSELDEVVCGPKRRQRARRRRSETPGSAVGR
jgi:diacylglycerol O-acyltransferase / wax synthase